MQLRLLIKKMLRQEMSLCSMPKLKQLRHRKLRKSKTMKIKKQKLQKKRKKIKSQKPIKLKLKRVRNQLRLQKLQNKQTQLPKKPPLNKLCPQTQPPMIMLKNNKKQRKRPRNRKSPKKNHQKNHQPLKLKKILLQQMIKKFNPINNFYQINNKLLIRVTLKNKLNNMPNKNNYHLQQPKKYQLKRNHQKLQWLAQLLLLQ